MSSDVTFADVVHQSITFREDLPAEKLVLDLIDTSWVQRLRDISQTANTRLVYMFSEHSRFGHSLGVAYLANQLMNKLARDNKTRVDEYRIPVSAAAILHDVGHLAPGSHTAYKTWFPGQPDRHEQLAVKIILNDPEIRTVLDRYAPDLADQVSAIIREDDTTPPWTREILSGGGWNVDRGNWCVVDSVMAGVNYGQYNIPALTNSIEICDEGHLTLRENRLDAMMHFALSRHAMYKQVYHHRVLLAADSVNQAIATRARELYENEGNSVGGFFVDEPMREVLNSSSPADLSLPTIFCMRESWWRYHLLRWSTCEDPVLADLSQRLLNRRLFKMIRIHEQDDADALRAAALQSVKACGYDPLYYLHEVSSVYMHSGESSRAMLVKLDDGSLKSLDSADPLYDALIASSKDTRKHWLVLPGEAKAAMGKTK